MGCMWEWKPEEYLAGFVKKNVNVLGIRMENPLNLPSQTERNGVKFLTGQDAAQLVLLQTARVCTQLERMLIQATLKSWNIFLLSSVG